MLMRRFRGWQAEIVVNAECWASRTDSSLSSGLPLHSIMTCEWLEGRGVQQAQGARATVCRQCTEVTIAKECYMMSSLGIDPVL